MNEVTYCNIKDYKMPELAPSNPPNDYGLYKGSAQNHHHTPPSVWLKEVCDGGLLGDIFMVKLDCYWNRDGRYYKKGNWHGDGKLDGGTLFTQFSHFIDIMYWLFGDIQNIRGNFADFNHKDLTDFEDSGVVTFDFVNGGMGCLNYSTAV